MRLSYRLYWRVVVPLARLVRPDFAKEFNCSGCDKACTTRLVYALPGLRPRSLLCLRPAGRSCLPLGKRKSHR